MSDARTILTKNDVLAALPDLGPRPTTSLLYRVSLGLVAFAIVLLPVLYAAFIGWTAWGCVWWAQNGYEIVAGGESVNRWQALAFITPIVVGAILVFFLLKPLVAPRAQSVEPLSLRESDEPVLFALIHRICELQGAPRPERIDVDLRVNASAGFRRGLASLMSRDMVLTIGLPLAVCLDLRQLTAVLCHEFGHFAQAQGMRAYVVIASVNGWLARVAYQRDAWDERLERWSQIRVDAVMVLLMVARLGVWTSRLILKGLLRVAHALAQLLSRQMEFDADAYAVRVVGAHAFEQSMKNIVLSDLADDGARYDLDECWRGGELPDDMPALVRCNLEQLEERVVEDALERAWSTTASMYASHPPIRERVEHAHTVDDGARMSLDAPATALFREWDRYARALTERAYRADLDGEFDSVSLVPAAEANRRGNRHLERTRASARVFGVAWPLPIAFDVTPVEGDAGDHAERQYAEALERAYECLERVWELENRIAQADSLSRTIRSGRKVSPRHWGVEVDDAEGLPEHLEALVDERAAMLERAMDELPRLQRRVWSARDHATKLGLVGTAEGLRAEVETQARLGSVAAKFESLGRVYRESVFLANVVEESGIDEGSPEGRASGFAARALREKLERFLDASQAVVVNRPGEDETTLRAQLFSDALPLGNDGRAVIAVAAAVVDGYLERTHRSLADIAIGVIEIERALEADEEPGRLAG